MAIPPKPTQFEGDTGRLIPELEQTGPNDTVSVGENGGSRDDLVPRYKKTMRDFLKSIQTNQVDGNKRDETTPFAEADDLTKHDVGKFFDQAPEGDASNIKNIVDAITTDLTTEEILRTIEGVPNSTSYLYEPPRVENNPVTIATSRVLSTNRFSPQNPYMTRGRITSEFAAVPKGFGTSEATETMSFDNLRKVGLSLMLRATGEVGSLRVGDRPAGDPTKAAQILGSLLVPGRAQLGISVGARDLYAQEAFGAPGNDRERIPNVTLREEGASPYSSYGQLNNMYEPFDGFNNISMIGLSIVLVIAIRVLVQGLALILGANRKPSGVFGSTRRHPSEMSFGVFRRKAQSGLGRDFAFRFIGIIDIDRPWSPAVQEGIRTFFDFGGTSFLRVAENRGFYVNLIRSILQSFVAIIASVVDSARSTSPLARVTAVTKVFDLLRRSKIVSFMNVMAQIGDKALFQKEYKEGKVLGSDSSVTTPRNFSNLRMPKNFDNSKGLQATKLAWRNTSAPAALILPSSARIAFDQVDELGGNTDSFTSYTTRKTELEHGLVDENERQTGLPGPRLGGGGANATSSRTAKRLSPEFVKSIEKYIEGSQYVPFYFQDLRTNEIISFHAFITSVTENFAPTYGSSNPYGRVDPVMSYTNTTRTFSLNFKVVATDEEDLESMYVKLNKFVTLVYPQWTKGRTVETAAGLKFTQPFSQTIGASPLVRIRLGDLIKTNFSNIALARLFGLGQKDMLDLQGTREAMPEKIQKQIEIATRDGFPPGMIVAAKDDLRIWNAKIANLDLLINEVDPRNTNSKYQSALRQWESEGLNCTITAKVPSDEDTKDVYYLVTLDRPELQKFQFLVRDIDLKVSPKEIQRRAQILNAGLPSTIGEFFDFGGDKNAVIKSFKNTSGKGLAGFITSLGMGWEDALTNGKWETGLTGKKVPHICEIQLQFTVIHDIQPGIDSDGFNRAPVYNVKGANPHYED